MKDLKYFDMKNFFIISFILLFINLVVFILNHKDENKNKIFVQSPNIKIEEQKKEVKDNKKNLETVVTTITLDKVFNNEPVILPSSDLVTLLATGDYIVARSVNYKTLKYNDYIWAVKDFVPLLSSGDITLINLENPLLRNCPVTNEGFTFCGTNKHIEGLKKSGVDVVNLANNHSGNYGIEGLEETKSLLGENGILSSGLYSSNVAYKNVKGITFAFLGYNDIGVQAGVPSAEKNRIIKEIIEAKEKADIIIVSFHWGVEYTTNITPRQQELAYLAIDAGADLIIGNHPHWIQPVEVYKDKLIVYAHGNFIFDQMWSEETKKGIVGEYTFYKNKLAQVKFYPVYITDYGKATIPNLEEQKAMLDNLKIVSYQREKIVTESK